MMLRFHTQTAGCSLTAQQPDNNIVRTAMEAAAVLGRHSVSAQPILKTRFWRCLVREAVRTALRTQQIIAYETGVADTIDPLAGSYFIEKLTDEIEALAIDYIRKIDDMGGAVKAIENGVYAAGKSKRAYRYQREIESKERLVVGVNCFESEEEPPQNL